jgi:hypothetical protein
MRSVIGKQRVTSGVSSDPVPALAGGIGLLRGRTWARVIILLLSLVMLFFFPIGTILGGFGIMALRGGRDTFRPLP